MSFGSHCIYLITPFYKCNALGYKINLKDDYTRYKKNTFFVKKLEEIKKIVNSFYNLEEQFENFEPKIFLSGNMKFNLVFNDYKFFYNEYYIKYASSNLKKQ